jgi:predicted phosphodiesterase
MDMNMTEPTVYAVLSDIHGNLPALQACAADAKAWGATEFLNLGDIASGPLWPAETVAWLMALASQLPVQTIAGNHEREVLRTPRERQSASDRLAAEQLSDEQLRWLASLPTAMRPAEGLICIHGTPASDEAYLVETVTGPGAVRAATVAEIRARLPALNASLLLCGHTHLQRDVLVDHLRVANPGSVGLPAYEWDVPAPHDIESGTPHARYALVRRQGLGWHVMPRLVAYDWEAAARQAERHGRPDWADALRTGRVGRREADLPR